MKYFPVGTKVHIDGVRVRGIVNVVLHNDGFVVLSLHHMKRMGKGQRLLLETFRRNGRCKPEITVTFPQCCGNYKPFKCCVREMSIGMYNYAY